MSAKPLPSCHFRLRRTISALTAAYPTPLSIRRSAPICSVVKATAPANRGL